MSGCRRWSREIGAYLDGELPAAARIPFEGHLPDCGDCREALEAQRELDLALRALPRIEPSPQFEAHFRARLARSQRETSRRGSLRSWRLLVGQVAFAAVTVTAIAWLVTRGDPALPESDWQIVAEAERFELLLDEDHELLWSLEVLEAWDGSEEI